MINFNINGGHPLGSDGYVLASIVGVWMGMWTGIEAERAHIFEGVSYKMFFGEYFYAVIKLQMKHSNFYYLNFNKISGNFTILEVVTGSLQRNLKFC